jgi:hypothetical protein
MHTSSNESGGDRNEDGQSSGDHNRKKVRSHAFRLKQAWKKTTISNKFIVLLTAVIALSNFAYVLYARRQWKVMSGQLEQMAQQIPELRRAANAAENAVGVAQNSLNSSNKSASDTLGEMKNQSKAMQDTAAASDRQSIIAAKQLEGDQRPWLGLDNADERGIGSYDGSLQQVRPASNSTFQEINPDAQYAQFILTYRLENYGHSPANFKVDTEIVSRDWPKEDGMLQAIQSFCDKTEPRETWPLIIVPGKMNLNLTSRLELTPQIREEMRKHGTIKPSIVGCIWYRFKIRNRPVTHTTRFGGNIYWEDPTQPSSGGHELPVSRNIPAKELKVVDVLTMGKAD